MAAQRATSEVAKPVTVRRADAKAPTAEEMEAVMAEVSTVHPAEIHRVAALKWSTRAMASYRVCVASTVREEGLSYFYLGEHYRDAALALAGLGEQWQPIASEVEARMSRDRLRAFAAVRRRAE